MNLMLFVNQMKYHLKEIKEKKSQKKSKRRSKREKDEKKFHVENE